MKSLFKKQMPGILVAGLVALAVGAAGAPAATAAPVAQTSAVNTVQTKALSKSKARAKAKAIKKCKKIRSAKKRKACIKRVKKRFAVPKGKTYSVSVLAENAYSPNLLSLKVNDSIKWNWRQAADSREAHNVSLFDGPTGLRPIEWESDLTTNPEYSFKKQFTKAGQYEFVCTLHTLMRMNVDVKR